MTKRCRCIPREDVETTSASSKMTFFLLSGLIDGDGTRSLRPVDKLSYSQVAARFVIASSRPFASQNLQAFLVVSFCQAGGG